MKIISDPQLVKYTHCAPESFAKELSEAIKKCQKQGLEVLSGYSSQRRVPNAYGYTTNMNAPLYYYDEDKTIKLTNGRLTTVSGGYPSRCVVTVKGAITKYPQGLKCQRRTEEYTELYVAG